MVGHTYESNLPKIEADVFARRFSLRTQKLMWFLGAGASATAGVPTAMDMVWDFKKKLFVIQRKVLPQAVEDLSNATVRAQLQSHVDSLQHLPACGVANEYAALFEEVYPSEGDRRVYTDAKIAGSKPLYGHLALATLMREQLIRMMKSFPLELTT